MTVSEREAAVTSTARLTVGRIYADPGDTITWDVGDNVVSIWFPTPGVFEEPLIAGRRSGKISAQVLAGAPRGVYEYHIYDHGTQTFAVSESHPKIEIPKP